MFKPLSKELKKIYQRRLKNLLSPHYLRSKRFRRRIYGLLWLILIIALFCWNWTLLLATTTGIGIMMLAYLAQGWQWENYQTELQKWFQGSNRRFSVAVGSGALSAFIIYLITTIWLTSENRWLATGAILQGLITLLIAGLLLWQNSFYQKLQNAEKFEQLLDNLTDHNQLKRLISIRKLTNLFLQNRLNNLQEKQINDYFQIMLSHEEELILQEALLESLEQLNYNQESLPIPLKLNQVQTPVKLKEAQISLEYD